MPETERAGSGRARSTHVVHYMAPAWSAVAERLAPLLARAAGATDGVQLIAIVPTGADAVELARALAPAAGVRTIGVWSSPRRALRLARAASPQVVVSTPGILAGLLAASAVSFAGVTALAFVSADELAAEGEALETVMAEVPAGAEKVLTAAAPTPFVDALVAAHMHGARRLGPAAPAVPAPSAATIEVLDAAPASPVALLADVLELVDPPSAVVVAADARRAQLARDTLAALGYPGDSPLARVVDADIPAGAALLVFVGAPEAAIVASAMATSPARAVALVSARERAALAAAGVPLAPFAPLPSRASAEAAEAATRDRLRRAITAALPAREMLALEPLLAEFDALALAGAALRLYEAERAAAARAAELASASRATAGGAAPARIDTRPERAAAGRGPRDAYGRPREGRDRPRDDRDRTHGDRDRSRGDRDRTRGATSRFGPRKGGSPDRSHDGGRRK